MLFQKIILLNFSRSIIFYNFLYIFIIFHIFSVIYHLNINIFSIFWIEYIIYWYLIDWYRLINLYKKRSDRIKVKNKFSIKLKK